MSDERVERRHVEEFLYHEAQLMDDWRLKEWLELFEPEGWYIVPSPDTAPEDAMTIDPYASVCLIADDRHLVEARIIRLESIRAHAESPRTRVTHHVTNVRIHDVDDDVVVVDSNIVVYRWRRGHLDIYPARCRQRLRRHAGEEPPTAFTIIERRVVLDPEALDPVGPISFIL